MLQPSQFVVCKEHQDGIEIQVLNPDGEAVSWPDGAQSYVLPIPASVMLRYWPEFLEILGLAHGFRIDSSDSDHELVGTVVQEEIELIHVPGTGEKIVFMDTLVCTLVSSTSLLKLSIFKDVLEEAGYGEGTSWVGWDYRGLHWPTGMGFFGGDDKKIVQFLKNPEFFKAYMQRIAVSLDMKVSFVEDADELECHFSK